MPDSVTKKPVRMTDERIQQTLHRAIEAAESYIEEQVAPSRTLAAKYFDGKVDVESEENLSEVVATVCRDAVRAIKPVLMRVFMQSDKPVEFVPEGPQAVDEAEQATSYASYVFDSNDGFSTLMDVFHDALVKKVGIVKPFFEETTETEFDDYSNITADQFVMFMEDHPDANILEYSENDDGTFSLKVAREDTNGRIKFLSVPPEDFFIDSNATTLDDCYICGHSSEGRVGDLVAMGFDFDEVITLAEEEAETEEAQERKPITDEEDNDDPSMRPIVITEAYMRMDIEGTGVPVRYKFICAGKKHTILGDPEPCDHRPFAIFEVDPEPHTFFGRSLVEIIMPDQDAATVLLRGLLDGIQLMNNPRVEVDSNNVKHMEEVLNLEYGAVIQKNGPTQAIIPVTLGDAATLALPAINYYDQVIRAKTGVLGAGMGMDADALQGQTATGVDAAVQAATAQAELYARVLAEGMRQLFDIIAQLARQHPQQNEMMQVDGKFVPVDPASWSGRMRTRANVGLGTNRHQERLMALMATFQTQSGIFQAYGPQNGLVSITNMRNTLADALKLSGIFNADRYYQPMDAETEQQLLAAQQQAAQQQQGSDPNAAFVQVESMKVQQREQEAARKAALDAQKAQAEVNLKSVEMVQKDDRERDKMAQARTLDLMKFDAQQAAQANAAIVREQAMPRG